MSVIDKIKLDGTTYDVGKTPDTTLAVSGSPADAAKVGTELDKKVDKVTGKGLSTEDFTTAEKTKLAGIAEGATALTIDATLTQSGQAADAKETGDKITSLKEDLIYSDYNAQSTFNGKYRVSTADDWEQGTISGSTGNKSSTTRSRTKMYLPIFRGDVIKLSPVYKNDVATADYSINLWYYDTNKAYVSTSDWYVLNLYRTILIENDGYIRLHGNNGDPAFFAESFTIIHAEKNSYYYGEIDRLSLYKQNGCLQITSDMLIKGSLGVEDDSPSTTGELSRAKTFNYFRVYKNDIIDTSGNDLYKFNVFVYNEEKTYITNTGFRNAPYKISQDGYVRILFKNTDDSNFSNFSVLNGFVFIRNGGNTIPLTDYEYKRIEISKTEDFAYGAIQSTGISVRTDRFYCKKYFTVVKGDIVKIASSGLHYVVNIYNSNGVRTEATNWLNDRYYIAQHNGFVRIHFYKDSGEITLSDYDDIISVIHPYNEIEKRIHIPPKHLLRKPKRKVTNLTVSQDGCIINDKLWMFTDGLGRTGNINIVDLNTFEVVETKHHTLGHANCVDYNVENNYLVSYVRGEAGYNHPAIGLYPNPSSKNTLSTDDEGYIVIKLYDANKMMSPSASLCWGEDTQTIYYMDGYYSDMNQLTPATSINIYKIQLGVGNNDLSNNGYGVYNQVDAGEYNGTCKVIKTYTGEVANGLDTVIGNNSYIGTCQGMEYDGYLYVGFGTAGNNFIAIELDDMSDTYRVVDNYLYHDYNDSYVEKIYEPELLALHNHKIICGSSSSTNGSLVLEFIRN